MIQQTKLDREFGSLVENNFIKPLRKLFDSLKLDSEMQRLLEKDMVSRFASCRLIGQCIAYLLPVQRFLRRALLKVSFQGIKITLIHRGSLLRTML